MATRAQPGPRERRNRFVVFRAVEATTGVFKLALPWRTSSHQHIALFTPMTSQHPFIVLPAMPGCVAGGVHARRGLHFQRGRNLGRQYLW